MAVINAKEDWTGLSGDAGAEDANFDRKFTVTFDGTENPQDRPFLASSHSDIPRIWSPHPRNSYLYVKNKRAEPLGPLYYEVFVYYASRPIEPGFESETDALSHPFDAPPVIEWGFAITSEPIDHDIYGKVIRNSAGETFDPPVQREFSDLVLRIQRNEPAFFPDKAAAFKDAVNEDWFLGFPPGTVRCTDFSARSARWGQLYFWQVSYMFQIRTLGYSNGWMFRHLDEGTRERTGELNDDNCTERLRPIKEKDDNGIEYKVSSPVALDGEGNKLSKRRDRALLHVFLEWKIYPGMYFSELGL